MLSTAWRQKSLKRGVYFQIMTLTQEQMDRRLDAAKRNWEMHQEIKAEAQRRVDHMLFLMNAGAFGISIAFLTFLNTTIVWGIVLMASWTMLGLSIHFMMQAHEAEAMSSFLNQVHLNMWITSKFTVPGVDWDMDTSEYQDILASDAKAKELRRSAKDIASVGFILLLLFAMANLAEISAQKKHDLEQPVRIFTSFYPQR